MGNRQFNIVITEAEAAQLDALRKAQEFDLTLQGYARHLFKKALKIESEKRREKRVG